jgi:hypothetical protein
MTKDKNAGGQVSVKLITGLTRGNVKSRAGETVKIGPGLAQRLVDRGQATFTSADAKRIKAKKAAQAVAAKATEGTVVEAPGPEKKGDTKPPETKGTPPPADEKSTPAEGDTAE